jgi:hypothetical protein
VTYFAKTIGGLTLGLRNSGSKVVAQDTTPAAGCPSTSPDENRELVRHYAEAVNNRHNPQNLIAPR